MTDYLLPCSCGERLRVSTRQAGEAVRCTCGTQLEVPTLRHLNQLEPVDAPTAGGPAWGDRQRVAFVVSVITLAALCVVGYLALNLPRDPVPRNVDDVTEASTLRASFVAYQDLQKGLAPPAQMLPEEIRQIIHRREMMLWGIKIALALAGCSIAVAVVGMLSGGRKKR